MYKHRYNYMWHTTLKYCFLTENLTNLWKVSHSEIINQTDNYIWKILLSTNCIQKLNLA